MEGDVLHTCRPPHQSGMGGVMGEVLIRPWLGLEQREACRCRARSGNPQLLRAHETQPVGVKVPLRSVNMDALDSMIARM